MRIWRWVAFGSALGGGARFVVADLFARLGTLSLPWSTLFINATGALMIGVLAALTAPQSRILLPPHLRHFAMTGFCGGYTTFSLFSLESLDLLHRFPATGVFYLGLTGIVCLIAVGGGYLLGTRLS